MIARIKVSEATEKTTKGGKPYLNVKSESNNWFYVWEDNRFIWAKFQIGATLDIDYLDGKFKTIVGIVGLEGEKPVAGQNLAGNGTPNGAPNAMTWIVEKMKEMNKKLDFLIEEKKTLNSLTHFSGNPLDNEIKAEERKTLGLPPEREGNGLAKQMMNHVVIPSIKSVEKESKLSDLEVTDLPDLN